MGRRDPFDSGAPASLSCGLIEQLFPRHDQRSLSGIASLLVGYAVPAGRLGRVATGTSSRSYRPPVRADLYGRRVWLEITWSSRSEGTTSAMSACASGCRRFFGSRGRSSGRQQARPSKWGRQFEGRRSARVWRTLSVFLCRTRSIHIPARPPTHPIACGEDYYG